MYVFCGVLSPIALLMPSYWSSSKTLWAVADRLSPGSSTEGFSSLSLNRFVQTMHNN